MQHARRRCEEFVLDEKRERRESTFLQSSGEGFLVQTAVTLCVMSKNSKKRASVGSNKRGAAAAQAAAMASEPGEEGATPAAISQTQVDQLRAEMLEEIKNFKASRAGKAVLLVSPAASSTEAETTDGEDEQRPPAKKRRRHKWELDLCKVDHEPDGNKDDSEERKILTAAEVEALYYTRVCHLPQQFSGKTKVQVRRLALLMYGMTDIYAQEKKFYAAAAKAGRTLPYRSQAVEFGMCMMEELMQALIQPSQPGVSEAGRNEQLDSKMISQAGKFGPKLAKLAKLWLPVPASEAPPTSTSAGHSLASVVNMATLAAMQQQLLQRQQYGGAGSGAQQQFSPQGGFAHLRCYRCQNQGHIAPHCPLASFGQGFGQQM